MEMERERKKKKRDFINRLPPCALCILWLIKYVCKCTANKKIWNEKNPHSHTHSHSANFSCVWILSINSLNHFPLICWIFRVEISLYKNVMPHIRHAMHPNRNTQTHTHKQTKYNIKWVAILKRTNCTHNHDNNFSIVLRERDLWRIDTVLFFFPPVTHLFLQ